MSVSITGLKLSSRYCGNLRQHLVGVQRYPARHDQRRRVVALPQRVDDRAHQPQHAAGALEPVQRRPVLVQPVEQLRVDRVRRLDPLLVGRLGDPGGELGPVPGVEVGERPRDRGDIRPARRRRPPRTAAAARSRTTRPPKRAATGRRSGGSPAAAGPAPPGPFMPADLDVGRAPLDLLRRRRRRRRRDGDHEHRARHRLDGLGERLRERELGVERAAVQVVAAVQLPRVGDPLVDQDQARRVLRGSASPSAAPGLDRVASASATIAYARRASASPPATARAARPARPTGSARACRPP